MRHAKIRLFPVLLVLASLASFLQFRVTPTLSSYLQPLPNQSPQVVANYTSTQQINNETNGDTGVVAKIIQDDLPEWLQTYLSWHQDIRAGLEKLKNNTTVMEVLNHTKDIRYLVVVCLEGMTCGGTADRLKSIPYWISQANVTKRMLFIHWNKDGINLKDFLVPPPHGFDWTIPADQQSVFYKLFYGNSGDHLSICQNTQIFKRMIKVEEHDNKQMLCVSEQMYSFSSRDKEQFRSEKHSNSYPYLFRTMFQPSEQFARYLEDSLQRLDMAIGLDSNFSPTSSYLAVHIRTNYPLGDKSKRYLSLKLDADEVAYIADHAVGKVIEAYIQKKHPEFATSSKVTNRTIDLDIPPIYIASDTPDAISYLKFHSLQYGANRSKTIINTNMFNVKLPEVFALDEHEARQHINFLTESSPADLYSIFFDLWMLSNADCIAYGVGGFGKMASDISMTSTGCQKQHRDTLDYNYLVAAAKEYWTSMRQPFPHTFL